MAKDVLDLISVYLSSIYDAYENTVSNNKLLDWEQTKLINECKKDQSETVKDLLWENHALGVRKLALN